MNRKKQRRYKSADVSKDVRTFYERMPYPAPVTNLDRHLELYRNPERQRALFHLLWPTIKQRGHQNILVAGCGTSQAATVALREPDAQVTAIDISKTSLRYTRDLQQKYRLNNLDLHQLSIENIEDLGRTFDQIICTGVLHHLVDPDIGLCTLRQVLKPEGAMHLMVYATYGRVGIYMMQEYCRLLGITPSNKDLRDLDTTLQSLPADHPIASILQRTKDFRHPDALADALLHPQDRAYTVPEVYEWLDRCGMSFGRWFEQAPYLPQCGIIANNPHENHLMALPTNLQHAAVEILRGTMVTHNFIAYRNDYPRAIQPIQFDRDPWENYIPLHLPWTLCIKERVPSGSVAVLINRAHTYPDLALPIDAAEERLFSAIDGSRTIGEILQSFADQASQRKALKFFKRLWHYDQILFDASYAFPVS